MSEHLSARFAAARHDRSFATLEGFHAVKHALRFGAEIDIIVMRDRAQLQVLANALAPDIAAPLLARALLVTAAEFAELAPNAPDTGVIAIARRPTFTLADIPRDDRPLVCLEEPAHIGNIGAVVRASAAAGAAGVITTGVHDPWNVTALRGSAGLHFALPVFHVDSIERRDRLMVAIDGEGDPVDATVLAGATLVFGSERHGVSARIRALADRSVALPMEPGVSSLNLATAVAVTLYIWRLGLASSQ